MDDDLEPTPVSPAPLVPATVRAIAVAFWVQAAAYAVGTLVAVVAYFARGADHLGLGAYAAFRTHPVSVLVFGVGVTGLLIWLATRLPDDPYGVRALARRVEILLVVDTLVSLAAGVFDVWSVVGLLAAVVVMWCLRADETVRFLR